MGIDLYTTEELEKELERREPEKPEKPEMLAYPVLTGLKKLVKEYIDYVASKDYCEDNDYKQYIFEEAVEAFYGYVWDWINKRT